MNDSPATDVEGWLAGRRARYDRVREAAGAAVVLLTSEAGLTHATGLRMYTTALIPERPVAALVTASTTEIVCRDWERDQIESERPGLAFVGFSEWGRDPWVDVAAEARRLAGEGAVVLLESTVAAAAVGPLEAAGLVVRIDRDLDLLTTRNPKSAGEIDRLVAEARAGDAAIASVVAELNGGWTERRVSSEIATRFAAAVSGEVEAAGICSGPASNRSNHHLAADVPLRPGPVRLGIKAQVDGVWLILTRMAWASEPGGAPDPAFLDDYAVYASAHEAGWRTLQPGTPASRPYRMVEDRLAAGGLRLRSPKVGHATGLTFRERPVLRPDETVLIEAGTFFAFDFAVHPESTRSATFVHVEDRILVTEGGPVRISDAIDTSSPMTLRL
jgi:Xaa-Pro aminopeptidase